MLLRDVQVHPYKQQVLHIDFQRVDAKTKLHMKVPLHYVKAEESQAVKFEDCVVNHVMSEIDISCLPADLPEFIEVDLSGMKKGMSLHLNDITLAQGRDGRDPRQAEPGAGVDGGDRWHEEAAEEGAVPAEGAPHCGRRRRGAGSRRGSQGCAGQGRQRAARRAAKAPASDKK